MRPPRRRFSHGAIAVSWVLLVLALVPGLLLARHVQYPVHRTGRHATERLPAAVVGGDGGDPSVRCQAGDQTDQESRSACRGAPASLTAWTSPFTRACFRTTARRHRW